MLQWVLLASSRLCQMIRADERIADCSQPADIAVFIERAEGIACERIEHWLSAREIDAQLRRAQVPVCC